MKYKGFTLIEMIIYMGILSIMLVTISDVFAIILNSKLEIESTSYLETDARYVLNRLKYDLARAESVSVPGNLGDASNSLSIVIEGVTYTYSILGTNLTLNDGSTSQSLNGSNTEISDLTFQKIGTSQTTSIKYDFSVKSKISQNNTYETIVINSTTNLR